MNNKKGIFNFLLSIKIHVYISKASKKKAQPRGIPFLTKTPPTPCTNKKGDNFVSKDFGRSRGLLSHGVLKGPVVEVYIVCVGVTKCCEYEGLCHPLQEEGSKREIYCWLSHQSPWSCMARATLMKPAMLEPATKLGSSPSLVSTNSWAVLRPA